MSKIIRGKKELPTEVKIANLPSILPLMIMMNITHINFCHLFDENNWNVQNNWKKKPMHLFRIYLFIFSLKSKVHDFFFVL